MDALDMPVGMTAAFLAVIAIRWGLWLHREELRTGQQPATYNRFLLFILGGGGLIFYLGAVREIEFFWDLMATTFGAFIALGLVHYVSAALRSRSAGWQSKSPQGQED